MAFPNLTRSWTLERNPPPAHFQQVLARLRPLEPEGAKVHETPLLRASLAAMLSAAVGDRADAVAGGLEDGQTRSSVSETGTSQTVVTVLRCESPDAARAYVAASKAFQKMQDRQYEGNPALRMETTYGDAPGGFVTTRSLRAAGGTLGRYLLAAKKVWSGFS